MKNSLSLAGHEKDLLSGIVFSPEQAGSGKRLANYVIDRIAFLLIIFLSTLLFLIVDVDDANSFINYYAVGFIGCGSIPGSLFYGLAQGVFTGLVEGLTRGKSLGKLITGTRTVNGDGSRISFKTGLLRGLSRAVPLEVFSGLGRVSYPWHDKWTGTMVVDERRGCTNLYQLEQRDRP
ncbi:MAG: RDD family protein [Bacteroidetes bacterium]|nr:RDD family protein [Bacteroidota bacterium]